MIEVTITVKHNIVNTCGYSTLCKQFSNFSGHFAFRATLFKTLLFRRSCGQCHAFHIIYHLSINLFIASKNRQTRFFGGTIYLMANVKFNLCSSYIFFRCHMYYFFWLSLNLIILQLLYQLFYVSPPLGIGFLYPCKVPVCGANESWQQLDQVFACHSKSS